MPEIVAHKIAKILLERRGFGFYPEPMEAGQDAYDITLEALNEADAIIEAFPVLIQTSALISD